MEPSRYTIRLMIVEGDDMKGYLGYSTPARFVTVSLGWSYAVRDTVSGHELPTPGFRSVSEAKAAELNGMPDDGGRVSLFESLLDEAEALNA